MVCKYLVIDDGNDDDCDGNDEHYDDEGEVRDEEEYSKRRISECVAFSRRHL